MHNALTSLPDTMINSVARRFRVLGEPQRLRILQLLKRGPRTVSEIGSTLRFSQPNVSRHLQSLYDIGALDRRREGNSIYYSVSDPVIFKLCDLVCDCVIGQTKARMKDISSATPVQTRAKNRRRH